MPDQMTDAPKRLKLSTGTRICLLLALLASVAAAYYYWVPITVASATGAFGCQSASNPPVEPFPKNACGPVNDIYRARALASLVCGVILATVGPLLFELGGRPHGLLRRKSGRVTG